MAEILLTLLSPIASIAGKWLKGKIKKKKDQEEIKVDVKSPDYSGTANHWVSTLYERIVEDREKKLRYAYIGEELQTSIEKDPNVATIKMKMPSVDKDAMKELMVNKIWTNQNDLIHGNGVFSFSLPQIVHASFEGDAHRVKYKNLSSIPLNGKYLFNAKLQASTFENQDPDDFYKHGGTFEIPIYLEKSQADYQMYPIMPPAPKIPDFAIRTKILKEGSGGLFDENNPVFAFCPYCGTKMPKSTTLKFCVSCGKNIEQHLNF